MCSWGNTRRVGSRATITRMGSLDEAIELYRLGRAREAESACETVLAATGEHAGALMLLVDIQLSSGRHAEAIAHLTALSRLRPRDAANLRRLGGALLSLSRADEAAGVLRRAMEIEPDNMRNCCRAIGGSAPRRSAAPRLSTHRAHPRAPALDADCGWDSCRRTCAITRSTMRYCAGGSVNSIAADSRPQYSA